MKDDGWHVLHRSPLLEEAHVVATSIEAMEFDVRLRHAVTGRVVETGDETPELRGPYVVEVRPGDCDDLADVLEAIIDEQGDFDRALAKRNGRVLRLQRILLLAMIVIVSLLALFRLIEL
jgi:hypothetical protein